MNFTDITTLEQLKHEQQKSDFLSTVNTSVHHEMIGNLTTNVEVCKRLLQLVIDQQFDAKIREMVEIIMIASNQVLLHAHDLID